MDKDEMAAAVKAGTKDAIREADEDRELFGVQRLVRAYAAQPDPSWLRRERRGMTEGGDDGDE